jgi:cell division protein FtsQ
VGKVACAVVAVILIVLAYEPIVSSSVFTLKRIIVAGNVRTSTGQTQALVGQIMGGNVLKGDLAEVRQRLKQQALIKDAVVTRLLPDTLRVDLIERVPVAVVQLSGRLACVDEEGTALGGFNLMGAQPALLGWDERGSALSHSANLDRLELYLELKRALSAPELNYWDKVDQVDVHNLRDVVVILTESPGTQIHMGNRDFQQRFGLILNRLDDVLKGRIEVSFIDVSDPTRVVVRPPKRIEGEQPAQDQPNGRRSGR